MSGVTPSESGLASGLVNTSLQVGGSIGLAILATLSATRSDNLLADGESTASALTSGYHLAFVIAAGLVIAAIGVTLTVLRGTGLAAEQEETAGEVDFEEARSWRKAAYSQPGGGTPN